MNYNEQNTLIQMIEESKKQSKLYVPGNYWKFYEKNILKQIKKNDLKKFRAWEGGAGVGNIQSFGGGEQELGRQYKRYFHPYDLKYSVIDNNFFVRAYNSIINKLSSMFIFFSFFALRASEGRKYFFALIREKQEILYEYVLDLDKDLLEISDSTFGDPIGFYKNEKFYTSLFLNNLIKINRIKRNTDFNSIENIVELGAGTGLLASCFLKLKKNVKYLIVDIPPTLFISEYYLKNLGFKVFGYEELKKNNYGNLNEVFKDFQVCCLPTWRLDFIKDSKFDLFLNIASFQEMEKEQSLNYIKFFSERIKRYIYLENLIEGHHKTSKEGSFGVLNPTTKKDLEKEILDLFSIEFFEIEGKTYKSIYEKN